MLRDAAEPAPHASIQPPLSPPARAAAAAANQKGRGKREKKTGEGVALSAAGTLHHRLPL